MPKPHTHQPTPDQTRRHRRSRMQGLQTPLGIVTDLSVSGVGIFHKGRMEMNLGDTLTIQWSHAGIDLKLPVRLVRIQPAGFRRHELGVEFQGLTPDQEAKIRFLIGRQAADFSPEVWLAA